MAVVFDKPSLWQRVAPLLRGFDWLLLAAVVVLAGLGLLAMYSSGFDHGTRFVDHGRNMLIAAGIMFVVAQVPPRQLMQLAVPVYTLGVALRVAVALFGISKKGAQRWINLGVVIQPSELLKIATPLMLAWWFHRREGQTRPLDFAVAFALLAVPVGLIVKQPDLGTAMLVLAAGLAGVLTLLAAFTFLLFRGLWIAAEAPTVFTRLLAGAVTLSFFTYAFVNMGMVSGILPVVGVPLPFVSYGGTAMVTLGLGLGILMSVAKSRRLMQS